MEQPDWVKIEHREYPTYPIIKIFEPKTKGRKSTHPDCDNGVLTESTGWIEYYTGLKMWFTEYDCPIHGIVAIYDPGDDECRQIAVEKMKEWPPLEKLLKK